MDEGVADTASPLIHTGLTQAVSPLVGGMGQLLLLLKTQRAVSRAPPPRRLGL